MSKLPSNFENPFDFLLCSLANKISWFFYKTKHTPNIITTYSTITGMLSLWYLYKRNINYFIIYYLLYYFFDCLDGLFARKYNMVTKFGDYYDHIKDTIITILLIGVFYYNYNSTFRQNYKILLIFLFLFILMPIHMSCQQKYYDNIHNINDNEKETLSIYLNNICPTDFKSFLNISRFFGTGTVVLAIIILVIYFEKQK